MICSVIEEKKDMLFFIGENGAGKTYRFEQFQKKEEFYTLFINEEGGVKTSIFQPKVSIFDGEYIYNNEANRGGGDTATKVVAIQEKSFDNIEFCQMKIEELNRFSKKSKGQEKLHNLLSVFLSYSLNDLDFVLFDEPENYLDENLIKILCELFKCLMSINIRIRVSTHSAKLLTMMNVELSNIILVTRNREYCVKTEDVDTIFLQVSTEVEEIRKKNKMNEDTRIKNKLKTHEFGEYYKHFLQQNVFCQELYSCLFHENIVLVEGNSDYRALIKLGHNQMKSVSYFSCEGKAYMPFYYKLFRSYNKRVRVIIDSDYRKGLEEKDQKHAYAITKWFEKIEDDYTDLVIHTPDLENYYEINIKQHKEECGLPANHPDALVKVSAAMKFFSDEENKKKMIDTIFKQKSKYEFE